MWLFPIGSPCFEELSFSVNLLVSFLTSNLEEFGVGKFSPLFFHLAPDEISFFYFQSIPNHTFYLFFYFSFNKKIQFLKHKILTFSCELTK